MLDPLFCQARPAGLEDVISAAAVVLLGGVLLKPPESCARPFGHEGEVATVELNAPPVAGNGAVALVSETLRPAAQ